jgi:hypothetical protein
MLTFERTINLNVNSGRAMLDTCHKTWILGTNSAFVGTEEKDRKTFSCTVQNLSDVHLFVSSIAILQYQQQTGKKKQ